MRLLFVFAGIFCILSSMAFAGNGDSTTKPDDLYVIHTPNDSDIIGTADISIEQLAEIIEQMEDSIRDVSVEYDWRIEPAYTYEESEKEFSEMSNASDPNKQKPVSACGPSSCGFLSAKDGITRHRLIAAGFSKIQEPNGIRLDGPKMFRFEESVTIVMKDGNSFDSNTLEVFNGKKFKRLQVGGWPQPRRDAFITDSAKSMTYPFSLTPLGFSVFRFGMSKTTDNRLLSYVLGTDITSLSNSVWKVNDFNAVRIEIIPTWLKRPIERVYFSVDHGYTPIRHAFVDPRSSNEDLVFDVEELQQIGEDLWFPSAGIIRNSKALQVNRFMTKGAIVTNQGLGPKDFDLDFPDGTRVDDRITGKSYTVSIE